jgi:hypothetical protein
MFSQKKAQVWTTDYIAGLLIFILALTLSVKLIVNAYSPDDYSQLKKEGIRVTENLLSEGYPLDWNETNVIRVGLFTNNRFDNNKINSAMNLSYSSLRNILLTDQEFFVVFKNKNDSLINFENNCFLGSSSVSITRNLTMNNTPCINYSLSNLDTNNLVVIKRAGVYNSSIIKMEAYFWN